MKKRVCIIGGGPSGLIAARHVSKSSFLYPTVFEQSNTLGGVWVYISKCQQKSSAYTSMYKNMRTNLPKHVMGLPDFQFSDLDSLSSPSFLHHSEVLKFINSYANRFELEKYIQFNKRVIRIEPILDLVESTGSDDYESVSPRWQVLVQDTKNKETVQHEFDAVLVCNGHFSKPFIPPIVNMGSYQGILIHSKDYDDPNQFSGKRVVIVGFGPSGVDICFEVAAVAKQVVVSNVKSQLNFPLPSNVVQISRVAGMTSNSVVLESGEEIECDVVILCTGYDFDFPFLTKSSGVNVIGGKRIVPLYKEVLCTKFPNLAFIGIQIHVTPFLLFNSQVQFCVKFLEGAFQLPNRKTMENEMENYFAEKDSQGLGLSWSHQLGEKQWDYHKTLAKIAGFELPSQLEMIQQIYDKTRERRWENANVYKDDNVVIKNLASGEFEYLEASS